MAALITDGQECKAFLRADRVSPQDDLPQHKPQQADPPQHKSQQADPLQHDPPQYDLL